MSVDSTNINFMKNIQNNKSTILKQDDNKGVAFLDELKKADNSDKVKEEKTAEVEKNESSKDTDAQKTKNVKDEEDQDSVKEALNDLGNIVDECNKVSQSDEKNDSAIKEKNKSADNEDGENMINNDINVNENKDLLPQMTSNMNFSGDGQPFSSFMKDENQSSNVNAKLNASEKDIAEEAAILSTMAENIAFANKKGIRQTKETSQDSGIDLLTEAAIKNIADSEVGKENNTKKIADNTGIKKVDGFSGITLETIVQYDNVIMNKADVEVFANLVQNGSVDITNLAPEAAEKSVKVSKTLADMLAKSMQDNKPLRIDFDNNISVIIRISRDGKLSADFLPSSQVAEAYLKENLPLLKQRFDDNNIQYDELNQRDSREKEKERNKRKDQDNE